MTFDLIVLFLNIPENSPSHEEAHPGRIMELVEATKSLRGSAIKECHTKQSATLL